VTALRRGIIGPSRWYVRCAAEGCPDGVEFMGEEKVIPALRTLGWANEMQRGWRWFCPKHKRTKKR
jgi:hypothetical protein